MNDMELAEEIERDTARYPDRCTIALRGSQWQQIIAALRRGPESWDAEVFRVKISEQLETIRELRQKLERPPSGEMVMVPKLIQQKDAGGCIVACLAMVTGLPYEEIRSKVFDFEKRDSANFRDIDSILYELCFAWQQVWLYGPDNKMRDPWPPEPWADIHMAEVRMPSGNTHSVVLLRNGDVLDPINSAPSKLTDYPQVHSVRAIYCLSASDNKVHYG